MRERSDQIQRWQIARNLTKNWKEEKVKAALSVMILGTKNKLNQDQEPPQLESVGP